MIKKLLKKVGLVLLVAFIIAQFFGPEKNDGNISTVDAFLADTAPPENVRSILINTCFDCHSDYTRYPWYNNITPVNYWLDNHVEEGKEHFNISKWNDYSAKKKDHKLDELAEELEEGHMPLPSYIWAHSDAKLSKGQIEAVNKWVKIARIKYMLLKHPQ